MQGKFTLLEDHAHNALPKLHAEKHRYDFILIDADHRFDGVFLEFYYADLLLKTNGFILLHDTHLPSVQHVLSWIHNNIENYTPVSHNENCIIFQKTAANAYRDWRHFKEFCLQ
jgi:hypothetical protein